MRLIFAKSSMDSLYLQYQKAYLSAAQELQRTLDGRASKTSPEALLEEVKLMVSFLYAHTSHTLSLHPSQDLRSTACRWAS